MSLGGSRISTQRFTPEFKEEAVRQVIERSYPVSEAASRVDVSTHRLYKWVKAVAPDRTEQRVGILHIDTYVRGIVFYFISNGC